MSATWNIGPHADPPVWDRYFVRNVQTGKRVERTEQKLASGGWHYTDIDTVSGDVSEWFHVPNGDGTFNHVVVVPD
jgi:hypothetical protein